MEVPIYKRALSYLYPVLISNKSSDINPVLKLYLHNNYFQLATADALYSDGKHYRPLKDGFKKIKAKLPAIRNVLVLGTGLGSAVHVLDSMGYRPEYTLVELDNTVLKLAMEFMPSWLTPHINPVCCDAFDFIERNNAIFDLLILDVFIGRKVPAFVTTKSFLQKCRFALSPHGILIFNYIAEEENSFTEVKKLIHDCFEKVELIEFGINKVFIISNA